MADLTKKKLDSLVQTIAACIASQPPHKQAEWADFVDDGLRQTFKEARSHPPTIARDEDIERAMKLCARLRLWDNLKVRRKRNPVQFIKEEIPQQLKDDVLTRLVLRRVSKRLYLAYLFWIRTHPDDDLQLKKHMLSDQVDDVAAHKRRQTRAWRLRKLQA